MSLPPSVAPGGAVPEPAVSGPSDSGPSAPAGWPPPGWPDRRPGGAGAPVSGPGGWPARPRQDPDWTPGRFHWGDALVVLVYGALMVLGLGLSLAMAVGLVPRGTGEFSIQDGFRVNLLSYAILTALVLAVAWRPLVTSLRVFRTGAWWKILLLPATWFGCIVINVVILGLIGRAQTSANQAALEEMTTQAPPLLMILMTVVAAPLVEEYLFRHLLVGKLSRHVNVWVCAAVSVLAFTLLHFLGTGGHFDPVELIPYLTLAVAITVSYILMGKSLAYSVLLHMTNNGIAIAMLYLVAPHLPDMPQPVAPTVFLPFVTALLG